MISFDRGGLVSDYAARFIGARKSGELVVIDGPCLSACTLVVGLVSRENVCATPKAVFGFHSAWRPTAGGKRIKSASASQAMLDVYPTSLREWISHRGGLSSKMIFLYGRELARIVRPCSLAVLPQGDQAADRHQRGGRQVLPPCSSNSRLPSIRKRSNTLSRKV